MILIVGGAGYIGSQINKLLSKEGYETIVFDSLEKGHEYAVKWGKLVKGNLGNIDEIRAVFRDYKIEAVLNFAAYLEVGESVKDPQKYYYNNLVNNLNLLKVMMENQVNKFIFSSTAATFGNPVYIPIDEGHIQDPINAYGMSKLMVEKVLKDYDRAYGMKSVIFRYFNASGADPDGEIGEDHNPESHLIPIILDVAAGKRESIKIFGTDYDTLDGTCVRDYIHVADLAKAHLLGLKYLLGGNDSNNFNLGNGKGFSVREIIEMCRKVTGKEIKTEEVERREGDPATLIASSEKIKKLLNWVPEYGLEKIIEHAWTWHEKMNEK